MFQKFYKSRVWIMLFMLLPFIGNAQIPGLPPGWGFTLNPSSATYAIPTTVAFSGVDALQAGDWIGAFYDDDGTLECGGAIQWTGTGNVALVAFGNDIYDPNKSGFAEGEAIQWKFYRTATSTEVCVKAYDGDGDEFFFATGDIKAVASFGSCAPPLAELTLNLVSGWNWVSFNVLPLEGNDLNSVLGDTGYAEGDFIQAPGAVADFIDGYGWYGDLEFINPNLMYQLKLASAKTLVVSGAPVNVAEPITLNPGWNWIGYKPQMPLNINTALVSPSFVEGDFIQTPGAVSEFIEGYGWYGDIELMNPGFGYQIKVTNSGTITYPESVSLNFLDNKTQVKANEISTSIVGREAPVWPNPVVFPFYQTNRYRVYIEGEPITEMGSMLSAWNDGEIRGKCMLQAPPQPRPRQFALQMGSMLATEPGFYFIAYDFATDQVYDILETHNFESNNNMGTFYEPLPLTAIVEGGTIDICGTVTDANTGLPIAGAAIQAETGEANYGVPDWPNPVVFPFYQTNRYRVYIEGEPITEMGSMLSAWNDGEIRGKCMLQAPPQPRPRQFALQMGSMLATEPGFYFIAYDFATDQVYDILETHNFESNNNMGTFYEPLPLTAIINSVVYNAITDANGEYCIEDVQSGTYTISASADGYEPAEVTDVVVGDASIVQDFELVPIITCLDAEILNFPESLSDQCVGEYSIDFSEVEALNGEPTWSVNPETAGIFDNLLFIANQDYTGEVTISLLVVAVEPCQNASAEVTFSVFPLPVVECPDDMEVYLADLPINLQGALPVGGFYSGTGVEEGVFSVVEPGQYEITYTFTDENGCTGYCTFMITVLPDVIVPELVFGNLHWPEEANIFVGGYFTAYGQVVIENGILGENGYEGLVVDFGISEEDTNPETWTNWYAGEYSGISGYTDRPEYSAELGNDLAEGTYYYAVRYTFNDIFYYGGYPNGFWDGIDNVSGILTVSAEIPECSIDWANVQWPESGEIYVGDDYVVYAQVYSENFEGQVIPGLTAWIGYSDEDVDPSLFTNWIEATFNVFVGNNSEYMANIGASIIVEGTYYYASRFQCEGGDFVYGGIGGLWESNSGVLTVLPFECEVECPADFDICINAEPIILTGAEPEGGEYSGIGVVDGVFYPEEAGVGEFVITYTYECEGGIAEAIGGDIATCEFVITVLGLVTVECPEDQELCFDDEPFVFGDFVFDPTEYEPGVYDFTFTEEGPCNTAECTFTITVIGPVTVECPEDQVLCTNDEPFVFGDFVFDPTEYEPGVYDFTFTEEGPCNTAECTFTITVLAAPVIVEQPSDISVLYGMNAEFSIVAEYVDAYQWFGPNGLIAGAEGASLLLEAVTLADQGEYYVQVTNECGVISSEVVTLTVNPWTQVIDLGGPVNGASTFLSLVEDDLATIFDPVMDDLQYVEFYQPNKVFVPGSLSFPFTEERGAKVGLKSGYPTSVTVTGYPTLGSIVNLPAGWSIMPVWSQGVVLAEDVFGPLGANLIMAVSIDYSGVYWPAYNIKTLEHLVPGNAYLVALGVAGTIDFDVPLLKATAPGYNSLPANKTSWNTVEMTGVQHIIAVTKDALAQLKIGDVLGAFNQNGMIAGMYEITERSSNIAIRIYGNEFTANNVNGFAEGDFLTFKVYRNGEIIDVTSIFDQNLPNTCFFTENGMSAIVGFKAEATSVNEFNADLVANLYPNPAKDFVTIETNFDIRNLKVVNYVGQVVLDRNIDQKGYQINTSTFGPGIYFVQIQTPDGVVITKRLTVN
ncbi:MAG: carboxypeptidase regulatory-like domain-containing protein [Bacteroidales bacterium]|nr:carboxypeptidase regulatory-like domain-containing protein [Bacteroidales bacterium]